MDNEVHATLVAHELVLRALARYIEREPETFMRELLLAAKRELQDEGVASALPDEVLDGAFQKVKRIVGQLGFRAQLLGDLPPGAPDPQTSPRSP